MPAASYSAIAGRCRLHLLLLSLIAVLAIARSALGANFVVNVGDDRAGDRFLLDGICDTANNPAATPPVPPSNVCTLRAAIQQANFTPGPHTIDIRVLTVQPTSQLPLITRRVTFRRLTTSRVTIDGSLAGANASGLIISGGGFTISGFSFTRFGGSAIELLGAGASRIDNCWIGIDANGLPAGNGTGIMITTSNANQIGSQAPGDRNIISANSVAGVWIRSGADRNQIYGNFIGTDVDGTGRAAGQTTGILVQESPENLIGGSVPGEGNVISGNTRGIQLQGPASTRNRVVANFIGVDKTGGAPLGNTTGIVVDNAPGNFIGSRTQVDRNVISGNTNDGILITQRLAEGNLVQGNLIGVGTDGSAAVKNGRIGIYIADAPRTTVGGSAVTERNIISGNGSTGIVVQGPDAVGTKIWNNHIGVDKNGTRAVRNGGNGVSVANAPDTEVGGPAPVTGSTIFRNVISGNALHGVYVQDAATRTLIRGNYIGTDGTGSSRLTNAPTAPQGQMIGIFISRSAGNTVGGASVRDRNVVSGNNSEGIQISGSAATANRVVGNYIGVSLSGAQELGNGRSGVFLAGANANTIGGASTDERNVISSNGRSGIGISGGATGNKIFGNYIGTDASGSQPLANFEAGVFLDNAADNEIGGVSTTPGQPPGNLISGNKGAGFAGAVHLQGLGTTGNKVRGNLIGTEADGQSPLPNLSDGVYLTLGANRNQIGGLPAGEANVIAFNERAGVALDDDPAVISNAIFSNSIHSSGTIGIDLGADGVTANQPVNPAPGANNLQNFPMLTGVTPAGELEGELISTPGKIITLQFFSSPDRDPSRFGEGKTLRATNTATTDANGKARFRFAVPVPPGEFVRMTATDPDNNTSEFSDALYVRLRVAGVKPASQASDGVFLPGSRSPVPVNAANFNQLKLRMRPLSVKVGEDIEDATVELTLDSGNPASVELYLADAPNTLVALPKRWTIADFRNHQLSVPLLAYGKAFGKVLLRLSYKDAAGVVLNEERLLFRVGHFAGAVGVSTTGGVFPYFRVVRTVNQGTPATAALDYAQHKERDGAKASVYVVPHRTLADWAADPSLTDVTGGPKPFTLTGPSIQNNITTLWPAGIEGKYDVVYDFGNLPEDPADFAGDGRLDPGDILDSFDDRPSLYVEPSLTAMGPQAVVARDYGVGAPVARVPVPAGYDGLLAGFSFRLRGRLVYPATAGGPAPLVVMLHGNHLPRTNSMGAITFLAADYTSAENFVGYDYLQRHLASRGYITVSIDLDEMYGGGFGYPKIGSHGIALRAWVALMNVQRLIDDPTFAGGAVAGRIDRSRIFLWGHSRGGEAAIVMHHLLRTPAHRPPGGPAITAFAVAGIRGIVSVSPLTVAAEVGFVTAGGVRRRVGVPGVPFLLLYGSADGDINGTTAGAEPFRHYDRATGDKYAIRLTGANHNNFNTSWSIDDALEQPNPLTGAKVMRTGGAIGGGLMPAGVQRGVAMAYTAAFLRLVNDEELGTRAFFLEPPARLSPLGVVSTGLHSQARMTASFSPAVIDDYRAGFPAVGTSSSGNPVAGPAGAVERALHDTDDTVELDDANRFFQEANGALFDWAAASEYTQDLGAADRDLRGTQFLCFRIAQQPNHPNTLGAPMTVTIEIEDDRMPPPGARPFTSSITLAALDTIPDIYPTKQELEFGAGFVVTTSAAFKTFRVPVAAFETDGQDIDLSRIVKVRIILNAPKGRVAVTDIEVEK